MAIFLKLHRDHNAAYERKVTFDDIFALGKMFMNAQHAQFGASAAGACGPNEKAEALNAGNV
jgi:hypothetical protein